MQIKYPEFELQPGEIRTIRELASRIAEVAATGENRARRAEWKRHHDLVPGRPMILFETNFDTAREFGINDRIISRNDIGKWLERQFLQHLYHFEVIKDDFVVEPVINCPWFVDYDSYGVGDDPRMTSFNATINPLIPDLESGIEELKKRHFRVDREKSRALRDYLDSILGDILSVRTRASHIWSWGLSVVAVQLVGMEGLMMAMMDEPDALHRLMAFLRDDHLALLKWLDEEGLLSLNDENDYVGSGTLGYVSGLPPSGPVAHPANIWGFAESQETVGVSPEMFEEFVFAYQRPIIEQFGLAYYGCCEPLHQRWHIVSSLPNLRAVSVSPWCDQEFMGEALGRDYVFCRKPNPAHISTDLFDEERIRADLAVTARQSLRCNVEIVMKDIHTLGGEPERAARWVQLARQAVANPG
jgi:hypothetical protein